MCGTSLSFGVGVGKLIKCCRKKTINVRRNRRSGFSGNLVNCSTSYIATGPLTLIQTVTPLTLLTLLNPNIVLTVTEYVTEKRILRFFTPQGRHVAPMGVKFDTEE